ncbi:hypothetical protein ACVIRM_003049 [Rhizobium laguerreae]
MQELTTVELRPEAGEGAANTSNFSPPLVGTRPTRTQSATPLRHRLPAAASHLLRAGMRMLGEEADHGRLLLFSPVFLGAGSAVWFLAASDFPLVASLLCLLALTVAVVIASRSRTAVRATLLALALVACGMVSAQLESWRISTVILDSAVTTTVTGRVERREGDGRGRWRYILAVTGTEAPQVKRPPERITAIARGADAAFEIGDIITGRARLTPPAGPALPELNDLLLQCLFRRHRREWLLLRRTDEGRSAGRSAGCEIDAGSFARRALPAAQRHRRPHTVDPARRHRCFCRCSGDG